jgi:hypothetical protein
MLLEKRSRCVPQADRLYAVARYARPFPPTLMQDESVITKQLFSAVSLRAYWEKMVRQLDAIAGKVQCC